MHRATTTDWIIQTGTPRNNDGVDHNQTGTPHSNDGLDHYQTGTPRSNEGLDHFQTGVNEPQCRFWTELQNYTNQKREPLFPTIDEPFIFSYILNGECLEMGVFFSVSRSH
ncbi:hypothetical protein DPMN_193085 [Dreissena polymorpha]|uniref:Uncharacterized protein n=1 Tax=Dreissena polymorpha TaxID=45954 RepID=A0A9D3Y253_DREPO|nr:hypothetical protein DPMN_193085 [Dreissena polymorpha]